MNIQLLNLASMNLVTVAEYLVYAAVYSIAVPVFAGIYFLKRLLFALKVLLAGLCTALLLNIAMLCFSLKTAFTFLYLFSAADIITMTCMFAVVINNKILSQVTVTAGAGCLLFIGADAFFISGTDNNGYSNAIEKILVLVMAVCYLIQLFKEDIESNLLWKPLFWVGVALIANNAVGSFDIFNRQIANYSRTLYLQFYAFWSLLNIFMYFAFAWAFWLCKHRSAD